MSVESSPFQVRYWPNKPLEKTSLKQSVSAFSNIFKNSILAANRHHDLSLPMTAGWDSRMILAACKDFAPELYYYTLKYRNLTDASDDILLAKKLLNRLGLTHHIINCTDSISADFSADYKGNVANAHLNDWGHIAYNMYKNLPDKVAIKGNCSEIGRCYYYPLSVHKPITSSNDFVRFQKGWNKLPFVQHQLEKWYSEIKGQEINKGYNLLDLFYWEHRMGSWQAQSQLEWDIAQEVFTPFNNRELLDLMLSTSPKYRCKPDYLFLKSVIKTLWKECLVEPINPIPQKKWLKLKLKSTLLQFGIIKAK